MTNIKIFGTLLLLLVARPSLHAQDSPITPYQFEWKKDAPTIAIGFGLSLGSFLVEHNMSPRSEMDLASLQPVNFLGLDDGAIDNYSIKAKNASDWLLRGAALLPLTLLADTDIRQDAGKVAVLGSEALLLTYGLTNLVKVTVRRDRPFVFNPEVPLEKKLTVDARLSFFSGHTSATAAAAFFTAKIWTDYHPESKWKPFIWTAAATLPAMTGYFRVKSGKHYFSDVATGYALGALAGYFVPHLHKIKKGEKRKLRMSTSMIDEVPVFNLKYRF